jgi:hypothetical protein|tara:strand:+ start:14920 stop:19659 length:4740 start_codon:yes stop_codon:yes gene_type:complete
MSSLNNINNNASVVNVGRTTPVTPGAQPAANSIPVVVATDQTAIPVVEQNKIQSEVALSLLGIPRSEVALGIFADVNTYDVNPSEWSSVPEDYSEVANTKTEYTGVGGPQAWGILHLPEESGAQVTAPADETAVLTSKRFFRYQPGRVSAATFGIKSSFASGNVVGAGQRPATRNPDVKKYGIFDKFDGYYWETRDTGQGDQFAVVRRTQSIIRKNPLQFGNSAGQQLEDHALGGKAPGVAESTFNQYPTATKYLTENKFSLIDSSVLSNSAVKCQRDLGYFLDAIGDDITLGTNYGSTFQGLAESNSNEYPLPVSVTTAIDNSETQVKALAGVDATADALVDTWYNNLRAVAVDAGTRVDYASATQAEQIAFLKAVTFTNPTSGGSASREAVKDQLVANRDFIAAEINAWVADTYPSASHNANKCTRDVLFVLNAVAYDVLYGGNSATYDAGRFFFYDGFSKSDQTADYITQTVAAYGRLVDIIDDIVKNVTITKTTGNSETQSTGNGVAAQAEADAAVAFATIIRDVIDEGDILLSLPVTRTAPDTSWGGASAVAAQSAIQAAKQTIVETVAPVTFTGDDLKCKRDLEFALDAYINDLRWGGNGHIIANAATYDTAILTDAEREGETHYFFRNKLRETLASINETGARTKIGDLAKFQIQAVTSNGTGAYPAQPGPDGTTGLITDAQIASATYGQRSKVETIFSVYALYYGYLVSQSLNYDTVTELPDGANQADFERVLKFKCIRDVKYVMNGYGSDLQFGGNAATAYNAFKYYSDGALKVYSQTSGGVVAEVARHQFLKDLITSNSLVDVERTDSQVVQIKSMSTRFALSTAQRDKLITLTDTIINNFTTEYAGAVDYGTAGQFGDLVILRDGLIMVHAGVYDPTLLKKRVKTPAQIDTTNNTLTLAEGSVIIGQYVNYYGDCPELTDGKTYFVSEVQGPKGNTITLMDPAVADFDQFDVTPSNNTPITLTGAGTNHFIETPVPFIHPLEYAKSFGLAGVEERYDGMFPYMYTSSGTLPADPADVTMGYIDTAIDTSVDAASLRTQIDNLNFKYKTWVRDHVDPTYYSVYEYRVGRTRFSGDALDGGTRNSVYSDNVLDKKAGELFLGTGVSAQEQTSVWDMDFSKVTMLKVEFSWYGAVGALFLAYVPVDNGEARWVRVHHLRCSNQLKISSLGNATLPITYLVYGGGSESRFGVPNANRLQNPYGSYSESLVKYGASYYIDGGDRGTVRLFNHSSETPTDINGSRYKLGVDSTNATDPVTPIMTVTNLDPDTQGFDAPAVNTYYMNARVITGNSQDQNVKVIWVDGNDLYLNKPVSAVSTLNVIVDRPALLYGLKTKDNITSGNGDDVRNRVQVYPTRLSAGSDGTTNAKMTLIKTPTFQTTIGTSGSFTVNSNVDLNQQYLLSTTTTDYLSQNGDFTYGYFRASLNGSETLISVLGRLEKANDNYYFYPSEIYNGTLELASGASFLKEGVFDPNGNVLTSSETTFEKERLSSVEVALRAQTPIPGTGTELASYYIAPGAEEFDLATYFDYNKEYISYPLTDQLETLFLATFSNNTNSNTPLVSLSASLTWEEQ